MRAVILLLVALSFTHAVVEGAEPDAAPGVGHTTVGDTTNGESGDGFQGFLDAETAHGNPPTGPPRTAAEFARALQYLEQFPAAPEAAGVAFDVYVAAVAAADPARAAAMWMRLALDHPKSVQHRFVLATHKPEDYRKLLDAAAQAGGFDSAFCRRYQAALAAGLVVWPSELLTGDEFVVRSAFLVRNAANSDSVIAARCEAAVAALKPDGKGQPMARVLFDADLTRAEKMLRLHAVEPSPLAASFETYYYDRLTPAERATPAVREAAVERLLEGRKFADALPLVAELLDEEETARRLFWRGWCEAATGRGDAAATFAIIGEKFADDPWAVPAGRAAVAAAGLDATLDGLAALAAAAVRQALTPTPEVVEARLRVGGSDRPALTVYARIDLRDRTYEATAARDNGWFAGVRTAGGVTLVSLPGEAVTHVFGEAMLIPEDVFKVSVLLSLEPRKLEFQLGRDAAALQARGGTSPEGTLALLRNLPPALVRQGLRASVDAGGLPEAVSKDDAGRVSTWLRFSARRPEVSEAQFRLDGRGRLVAVETAGATLYGLRFGRAADIPPNPPGWPERPEAEHEKFDLPLMLQLFAVASKLWSEEAATVGTP